MYLIADLTGDGKLEMISLGADKHSFSKASFSIHRVTRQGREAKTGERLFSLITSDDYCSSIELKDIDSDGRRDIIITTISENKIHKTIAVIKYIKDWNTFRELRPDKPFNTLQAEYSFTPKRGEHDPELQINSTAVRSPSIFSKIQEHYKKKPRFLYSQIYQINKIGLKLYEARYISTPFFILHKFLKAVRSGKRFTAYKYITYKIPFPKFKKFVKSYLPDLYNKNISGRLELTNWYLELFKKRRTFGWMTFRFIYEKDGKKRFVDFQVFMKRNYDEWKITLIRKIRIKIK